MRRAKIGVWVLTGDKVGTARSIARSCKLTESSMKEILIEGKKSAEIYQALNEALDYIEESEKDMAPMYTLITGDAIHEIVQDKRLQPKVSCIPQNFGLQRHSLWK